MPKCSSSFSEHDMFCSSIMANLATKSSQLHVKWLIKVRQNFRKFFENYPPSPLSTLEKNPRSAPHSRYTIISLVNVTTISLHNYGGTIVEEELWCRLCFSPGGCWFSSKKFCSGQARYYRKTLLDVTRFFRKKAKMLTQLQKNGLTD